MVNLKWRTKNNYILNLKNLVQNHKDEPNKNNMTWIQEAINMYYIMGVNEQLTEELVLGGSLTALLYAYKESSDSY